MSRCLWCRRRAKRMCRPCVSQWNDWRRFVASLLALCLGACQCDSALIPWNDCGAPCGDVPAKGECRQGTVVCRDGDSACVGVVSPTEEKCDDLDNDCDGRIDEYPDVRELLWWEPDNPCGDRLCGTCRTADYRCIFGEWICVPLYAPIEEVCDGKDNDCDCVVDDIPVEYFYPDPTTDGVGECRPGVRRCLDGEVSGAPPILPTDEACDGKDNDCDGLVDEGNDPGPQSFLIVLDVSGSMWSYLPDVTAGLCDFSLLAEPGSSFALAAVATTYASPWYSPVTDFTSPVDFCAYITGYIPSDGGIEPLLEPLAYPWSWPEDSVVIFLGDEPFQSASVSVADAVGLCSSIPFSVVAFVSERFPFDSLSSACGGEVNPLPLNAESLTQDLLRFHLGECQ